jgi:hypothetical protein
LDVLEERSYTAVVSAAAGDEGETSQLQQDGQQHEASLFGSAQLSMITGFGNGTVLFSL